MNVRKLSFVLAILTGYAGISFGILKIYWRMYGVHFYASEAAHLPGADLALDAVLIFIMILSGMCLVVFRAVVPALLCLIATFSYEFTVLHDDHHNFLQHAFAIGAIAGQLTALLTYVVGFSDITKTNNTGIHRRTPPRDV